MPGIRLSMNSIIYKAAKNLRLKLIKAHGQGDGREQGGKEMACSLLRPLSETSCQWVLCASHRVLAERELDHGNGGSWGPRDRGRRLLMGPVWVRAGGGGGGSGGGGVLLSTSLGASGRANPDRMGLSFPVGLASHPCQGASWIQEVEQQVKDHSLDRPSELAAGL